MQDFVSTYLSDKYPMRHKRDLIFYGEEIPQINTSSRFYFPVIILRISLSLFRASSGVLDLIPHLAEYRIIQLEEAELIAVCR